MDDEGFIHGNVGNRRIQKVREFQMQGSPFLLAERAPVTLKRCGLSVIGDAFRAHHCVLSSRDSEHDRGLPLRLSTIDGQRRLTYLVRALWQKS